VRAWVELRLAETSLRDLADEVGVAKSSIDKFVKGESLPQKNWPKLRFWFLRDRRTRKASLQEPADMALLVLETLRNVPAARRREAIVRTLEHFEALHRETRAPRPEWLDALRELADAEGVVPPPERGRGAG
jgi:AcrR family transcriptional regulator